MSDDQGQMLAIGEQACMELLRGAKVGRLVFDDADGPVIVPLNYVLESETIFVRTARGAEVLTHLGEVIFEVDSIDDVAERGWSVIVHGRMRPADPAAAALLADRLRTWAPGERDEWMAIEVTRVTGRWVSAGRAGYRPEPEGYL